MGNYWLLPLLLCQGVAALVRFDCHPEPNANQQNCESRGCIWQPADNQQDPVEPWCFMKPGVGYKYVSQTLSSVNLVKNSGPRNPWGQDFSQLTFSTSTIGATLNIRITTTAGGRYEPPVDLPRQPSTSSDKLTVKTNINTDPFSFEVVRKSSNRKIFDTSIGGLIFSDKFIQIASYLPSDNMYGFGENIHQDIKHDFSKYLTWGMFARDEGPNSAGTDTKNLYGVHPFYMIVEPDGKAHGVFILNSNAQEVTTAPGPSLIYRTIGGMLDMYFFPGPTPEEVIKQYQTLIGKPFLPAYWALGYQLSRWGYQNLDEMKQKIANVRGYGIPLDIAVVDIDYMDRYKDFTVGNDSWSGLPAYVDSIRATGMRMILIFDPAVQVDYPTFQRGLNMNARFIEWERPDQVMSSIQNMYPLAKNTKIMLGVVWPDKHVAFPDFLDTTNATTQWWINEFNIFRKWCAFDGIWIDMNEPSNFGTNENHPWYFDNPDHPNIQTLSCPSVDGSQDSEWDMPPYKTHNVWTYQDNTLATKTMCLLGVQQNGTARFYNVKSLYGWSEAKATQQALFSSTGKRGAVISRSTFPSSGRFGGHWLGDNTARWDDLRTSVIGAQEFNMFGLPYVGSDVCGFNGPSNEELCLRWQQMGAFHSFFRNHNAWKNPPQDPAQWPSVAAATKKANLFRYRYLPYLYTLHHLVSSEGGTVVRPVFFEFPHDSDTYNLGYQFMWGSNIMVAPVLFQGATLVDVYIPDGSFYSISPDYMYGRQMESGVTTVPAPTTSQIPVFARIGSVIPRQVPGVNTAASRLNPFEVLIVPDFNLNANGLLRWDDGESIVPEDLSTAKFWDIHYSFTFTGAKSNFTINVQKADSSVSLPTLDTIEIFSYSAQPDFSSFQLNGKKINVNVQQSSYSAITQILVITTKNFLTINPTVPQSLTWSNYATVEQEFDNRSFYKVY